MICIFYLYFMSLSFFHVLLNTFKSLWIFNIFLAHGFNIAFISFLSIKTLSPNFLFLILDILVNRFTSRCKSFTFIINEKLWLSSSYLAMKCMFSFDHINLQLIWIFLFILIFSIYKIHILMIIELIIINYIIFMLLN